MSGTTNVPGVCVLMRQANKGLFILRTNTGFKDNEYCVPSGHVEDAETFKQAACRETLEEVGVTVRPEDLTYMCTVHRQSVRDTRIDVWFEAIAWQGEPENMEPERHGELAWFDLDELPENIMDYMLFGLDVARSEENYGEFNWPS